MLFHKICDLKPNLDDVEALERQKIEETEEVCNKIVKTERDSLEIGRCCNECFIKILAEIKLISNVQEMWCNFYITKEKENIIAKADNKKVLQ